MRRRMLESPQVNWNRLIAMCEMPFTLSVLLTTIYRQRAAPFFKSCGVARAFQKL